MNISNLLAQRMTVSFETFPPKDDRPLDPILSTIDKLMGLKPDFISCTYGAGGTNKGQQREILRYIAGQDTQAMANYTCIGNSRQNVRELVDDYVSFGVNTFLALRGDFPKGQTETGGDFDYGCQLIAFLKENYPGLEISGGCYPEKHLNSVDMDAEISYLLSKQEAGVDFVVSQLCHDLDNYFYYVDKARRAGFHLPIIHGLMPVLSKDGIIKMTLANGCSIPRQLAEIIGKYGDSPDDFKKAGKEYTVNQIARLLSEGVDGIHVFALNKYDDVADIVFASGLREQL